MQLKQLQKPKTAGSWNLPANHEHGFDCGCRDHVWLEVNLRDHHALHEATYKEIAGLIDSGFLNQRIRATALSGIQYVGFEDDTMQFYIKSAEFEDNSVHYTCQIKFDEWEDIGHDPDLSNIEKARMLLWVGNIKLHCDDPSFLYWGYQYLLTTLGASLYPEDRKPVIRNPHERGIVCKHLYRILKVLPFYAADIGQELAYQFGGAAPAEKPLG